MSSKDTETNLFLPYGIFLAACGTLGYLLTHAKSALISGLASAALIIIASFFVSKSKIADYIAKFLTLAYAGVFAWRFSVALQALLAGADKLIATILLGCMMSASLIIASLTIFKK